MMDYPIIPHIVLVSLAGLLSSLYIWSSLKWRNRSKGNPLPPGPKPHFVVGNLFDVPTVQPWVGYRDLAAKVGSDIMYLRVLSTDIVILSGADVIKEFLDNRSAITSDRKQIPLFKTVGLDELLVLMPYGRRWKRHRRTLWQQINPTQIARYKPMQRAVAHKFLLKLLREPLLFKNHIRYVFCATMCKVIYDNEDDADICTQARLVEVIMEGITQLPSPGRFLAAFVPFIHHLPEWFLGPELRRKCVEWSTAAFELKNTLFMKAKAAMEDNSSTHQSMVKELLSQIDSDTRSGHAPPPQNEDLDEDVIRNVASVTFTAGADTTYSTLQSIFLAISLYPDVLKKAHDELDYVVGAHRLPDFDDRKNLVYINAILKEALRWHLVAPLGGPHTTTHDDVLNGYFIPAGTIVFPNSWACMHDLLVFDDPEVFRPERFIKDGKLDSSVRDPYDFAFGYGRRICPGRAFADASLFIIVASLLHTFDIGPPLDADGKPIKIEPRMASDGLAAYPEDCRCTITPRSAQAEALIVRAVAAVDSTSSVD